MTYMYGKGKLTAQNIKESMGGSGSVWQVGSQQRFNHTQCPAGADTKERLYIKRPMDNPHILIAYCHNCGCSGVVKDRTSPYRSSPLAGKRLIDQLSGCNTAVKPVPSYLQRTKKLTGNQKFPKHYVSANELDNWSRDALRWFITSGISDKEMTHYEYHYDPSEYRVWHPIYPAMCRTNTPAPDDYKKRVGAQGRGIGPARRNGGAKYLTIRYDETVPLETTLYTGSGRQHELEPTVVICEDYVSAIRLVEPGMRSSVLSVPLFGSHMRTEYLCDLVKKAPRSHFAIWLDNDNETVVQESQRLVAALEMIGMPKGRIMCITETREPKHLTLDQLNKALDHIYLGIMRSDGKLDV